MHKQQNLSRSEFISFITLTNKIENTVKPNSNQFDTLKNTGLKTYRLTSKLFKNTPHLWFE